MAEEENKRNWLIIAREKTEPAFQKAKSISDKLDSYSVKTRSFFEKFKTPPEWVKLLLLCVVGLILLALTYATVLGIWHLVSKIHFLFFDADVSDIKDAANKDNFNQLRNALFILAALIGIPFFLWRTGIAQSQASTARDRAYTELFTKAIEQLGAEKPKKEDVLDEKGKLAKDNAGQPLMREIYVPNIEVRIGAIYALERIMNDSRKDAPAIVDTLAAYVRENCGEPQEFECKIPKKDHFENVDNWLTAVNVYVGNHTNTKPNTLIYRAQKFRENSKVNRSDIKTALTVICRRPEWIKREEKIEQRTKPDLTHTNFQGGELSELDLSYCNLNNSHFQGANFNHARITGATLKGTNFQASKLFQTDLSDSYIFKSNFQGSSMTNSTIQRAFISDTNFEGVDLVFADFRGSKLYGIQTIGYDILTANVTGCDVLFTDFSKIKSYFGTKTLEEFFHSIFGHKALTDLPEAMEPPEHWSEADMGTQEGHEQYQREWEAFKKQMGVE